MFVHLRVHSEFSVVDSTVRIDELVQIAQTDAQAALAVTDLNNLFGLVKFYNAARQKGIKPLIGCDICISGLFPTDTTTGRLLLLVQNQTGYLNLCELLTQAWTDPSNENQPVIQWAWLKSKAQGLIALSGAQSGSIGQALLQGDETQARSIAQAFSVAFPGRFYVEVQRSGREDDEAYIVAAVPLAHELQLPLVATHPVQFLRAEDYDAHEARVCVADGDTLSNPRRVRRFTPQQFFKTQAEMAVLFADIPNALVNTVEIAKRCNLELTLGTSCLPDFPIASGLSLDAHFVQAAKQGLQARLARQTLAEKAATSASSADYETRLDFEVQTIIQMGFPGYFLIVADFIAWAKSHGCPVGPGRGSGAGSLVAYALGITDLDPLRYQLLFERFLNPQRVSMPDFDIDFCQQGRDRVIDYVKSKYGSEAVSQIATFGTMAARAAIRDVGRVLDLPYSFCDGIAKLIPNKPGISVTLAEPPELKNPDDKTVYAFEQEPQLRDRYAKEEDVRTLIDLARRLEGLPRNVGMHAGGVLIAPGRLVDFCPLYQQPGSTAQVSQLDKDDVEAIGLVKFDFLGLATLTILEKARQLIAQRHPDQAELCLESIPLDDPAVYRLFAQGQTEAVFQFESEGMQAMMRELKPTRIEDLIAMNALYRPGPMDLIPSYIARKAGQETVVYPDPRVESILAETYGIMVYQEQVMQMAQLLGGYSLGDADLLRRAMGKKKPEEMAQHRSRFREGAALQGLSAQKADEVFDLMEKFAGYGFNKSHSAAYALLAYYTAWFKVHYTAEFFCANMSVELGDTDKLKVLWEDAQRTGISFEPPHVNDSDYLFFPVNAQTIRYGLGAVKGSGEQAVANLVMERKQAGPFTDLVDFCRRVDRSRVNKRAVESLIKAGAFDGLGAHRAQLLANLDRVFEFSQVQAAHKGQGGLFDTPVQGEAAQIKLDLLPTQPWGLQEQLEHEKLGLGFCFSGHFFDEAAPEIAHFVPYRLKELVPGKEIRAAGIVTQWRLINGQRGRLVLFKLDDHTAQVDVRMEEALWQANRELVKEDQLLIVQGKFGQDRFSGRSQLSVARVWDLPLARCHFGRYLQIDTPQIIPATQMTYVITELSRLLKTFVPPSSRGSEGEEGTLLGLPIRWQMRVAHSTNKTNKTDKTDKTDKSIRTQIQLDPQIRCFPSRKALQAWQSFVDTMMSQEALSSKNEHELARVQVVYS